LSKVLQADGHIEDGPCLLAQLLLVHFKLGGRLTLGVVLLARGKLFFLLHPLHDLGSKAAQSAGGTAVFGSSLGVAGPIHTGLAFHLGYP